MPHAMSLKFPMLSSVLRATKSAMNDWNVASRAAAWRPVATPAILAKQGRQHLLPRFQWVVLIPLVHTIRTQTTTVFSKGGTSPGASDIFVLSPDEVTQIAPILQGLRVTVIVENATAYFISQVYLQSTSDGITWQSFSLESAQPDNRTTTTDWYSVQNNFKRGIRVGVVCSQENAITAVQFARVTLIIDFETKN